ncbi:MAG: hypothetical protein ABIF87_00565 [Pseudomonadota bacterium]
MTDTIIGAFIGVVGAIAGAIIAGTISYYVAVNLIRRQEFYRACAKFREAFIFEIDFLKHGEKPTSSISGTTYDVLTKAYKTHRIAYESFRLVLPSCEHISFDKAWDKYLYPDPKTGTDIFDDYISEGDEPKQREKAHNKISKLLEFAKLK